MGKSRPSAASRRPATRPGSSATGNTSGNQATTKTATRYPKGVPADRSATPRRSVGQQARLWLLSLCGAVPGAIAVYLTNDYWVGAWVFLAVVIVLGILLYAYEKRKKQ
ncbi:hypothetical protein [Microlunatus endophyticus]|uniref:hypothetical protein n=1 Tax=Microlunatus endophyticus TaxID=1716077 RepID=UPI001669AD1B|nr:hypothetical protein [Microlunatus endophyticus]